MKSHADWSGARVSVISIALVSLLGSAAMRADIADARSRQAAPNFSLPDATGAVVKLSDYRGKVVLLDFWATWCAGCKVEIPWFMEFQKKYERRGLASVGVAMDEEGWALVKPYLAEHPISYPVVLGDLDLLQKSFGLAPALPVTLLIDRKGHVAQAHAGLVDKRAFEKDIQRLLQERK